MLMYGLIDETLGSSWEDALNLSPYQRALNPDNYAFFALLMAFAKRGWRLSLNLNNARSGRLEYDENIIGSVLD